MGNKNSSEKIVFTSGQNFKERDYWLSKLSGKLVKSTFPRDVKKIAFNKPQEIEALHFSFPGELSTKLMKLSNNSDYRLHIVIVTGIAALLHKYTESEDILVGIPTYKQDVEGELVNTVLVLRNQVQFGMTFKELLLQVGQTILEADQNQNYPIEILLYKLNLPVLVKDFPLFDAAILLENIHDKSYLRHVNPNMIFSFLRTGEHIEGVIEYNLLLFDKSTIEIIINHFLELLHQAIIDINRPLPVMNIVSQKEKKQLLIDFNDNNAGFSKDKTIYHFIEKYADITPARTAILFEGTEVSCRSLNQRANRLARVLGERGIQPDEPVGILLNRTPRMAESILAVWKAGGAYIPMDPDYPIKRIIEILKDSKTKVLLTCSQYIHDQLAAACSDIIVDLDKQANDIERQDTNILNPGFDIDMNGLAYIIYTSGSTGKPKGVMVEHIGMMNHICAKIHDLHLSEKSVVAQNASHTFDISVWQFFAALTRGGKTVIYPNRLVLEPERFINRVIKDRVTVLEVVPSYLSVILETLEPGKFRPLDYLIVTGEALKPDLVTRWFTKFPGIKMVNAYGPTEASDDITHHIMDKPPAAHRVPIGKPVQNFNIYILDKNMQLCPLRVKGEICVSGIGVGRGYLNNPELTAQKFQIPNPPIPRHPTSPTPHSPIYRTGDLGCWLPDGTIEFFGRKDYQVKIRGFRIELQEIENQLMECAEIKEAVIINKVDEKENNYLCAYIVPRGELNAAWVKQYLSERLPDYMVPAHVVQLERFPLTLNGKIDRRALPEPAADSRRLIPYITKEMLKNVVKDTPAGNGAVNVFDSVMEVEPARLSPEELEQILFIFNDTEAYYPNDKTVHRLFEEQVVKTPDSIALMHEDHQVTYSELNGKSNQLARLLRRKGVQRAHIVGFILERSIRMIAAILAILKAGGAYLPIGPEYPAENITYMLKDCGTEILLVNKREEPPTCTPAYVDIDDMGIYAGDTSDLSPVSTAANPVHILYTSGTTGKPKGVIIEHRGFINYLWWAAQQYLKNRHVYFPLYTSISFDLTGTSIFTPLITGNAVVIYSDDEKELLIDKIIEENKVDIIKLTPSYLKLIRHRDHGQSRIKTFILGGEELETALAGDIFNGYKGDVEIYNEYGPTETVIGSMIYPFDPRIDKRKTVPIGIPINNTGIYLLTGNLDPVPTGITGELYISGVGVARGYLNQPGLTAEKFVDNPFALGQPMYRTGDIARRLPDRNIEFLGRKDFQVKIRGYRVELGEIENHLLNFDKIESVVVTARQEEDTSPQLCACIVSQAAYTSSELREYLLKKLPAYMIPTYFAQVEEMPLTPNGKVNRKLLEAVDVKIDTGIEYTAPRDKTEKKLAGIWSEVLGLKKEMIDIDANFFDLGGHSLKAIILVSRIHKEMDIKVPLVEMFEAPFIRELAQYLKKARQEKYTSIQPAEEKDYYPLSSAQKRLYFLYRMDTGSISYNTPIVVRFEGGLQKEAVEKSFNLLIQRHETLRTSFQPHEDEIVQRVHGDIAFNTAYYQAAADRVKSIIDRFIRPFDLGQAPLLKVGLIEIGTQDHIMMIDMHHIITDGMSASVFLNDLMTISRGKTLSPLKIQYKDYAQWQTGEKRKNEIKSQEDYWLGEFAGEIPVFELPYDFPRPVVQSFEGSAVSFTIGADETSALKELVSEKEVTLFMVLLALFNILLAKLSNQEDIIIGTAIEGRRSVDLAQIMGMFVNSLALRNQPAGSKSFNAFLREVRARTLAAYDNQDYQFEDLVEKVSVTRDTGRNPLFDVMFSMMNIEIPEVRIPGLKLTGYEFEYNISKFDMMWVGIEAGDRLFISISYSTKLYKEETIENFIQYFRRIISSVLENTHKKISDIEIIGEKEKRQLLDAFNDTGSEAGYPGGHIIHELFEQQVEKTPDRFAVVETRLKAGGRVRLTYSQLSERSNGLAGVLMGRGVKPNTIVGIMTAPCAEMVIGILAILKAGRAYLPIDPDYPGARIEFMLADSNTNILLTTREFLEERSKKESGNQGNQEPGRWAGETILIEEQSLPLTGRPQLPANSSRNLAYLIYTSGTSGQPKGVMIEHHGLVDYVCWAAKTYVKNESVHFPLFTSISFDLTVTSIYTPLVTGNSIVVYGGETGELLIEKIIDANRVGVVKLTPAHLKLMADKKILKRSSRRGIKRLIVGGEELETGLAEKIHQNFNGAIEIFNEYGPTETVVGSMIHRFDPQVDKTKSVPIGVPADNTRIYLLDRYQKPVPVGVKAEIYISADTTARGYLNRPELTAERFVPDPFIPGKRMYRTGDQAIWLHNGKVEFLGRSDRQVKIRGFRIEPVEIERLLAGYALVKDAVVGISENPMGEKQLAAYVVPVDPGAGGKSNHQDNLETVLWEYLEKKLPPYMMPSYLVLLEALPLTKNGKIDRRALPQPEAKSGDQYTAPRGEIEEKLAVLWSQVLDLNENPVSIDTHFFRAGGHSLSAIRLLTGVHKAFGVIVPLTELFKRPTIKGLSGYINGTVQYKYASIKAVEKKDYYALSSAQKRLYILHRVEPDNLSYNMLQTVELGGTVDKNRLEDTFARLIRRHQSLRTSFEMIEGEPVQRIHDAVDFRVQYPTAGKKPGGPPVNPGDSTISVDEIIGNFNRPFDLSLAPILRVGLIHTHPTHSRGHGHPSQEGRDQEYILMVDMHHIVSDGTSHDILVSEFMALYEGKDLPGLRIHYKDYSGWMNKEAQRKSVNKQEEHWLKTFAGKIPVLTLPTDHARPEMQSFAGSTISFAIGKEETLRIKALALENDSTLFMVLLALFYILLSKISGQEDIVIGTGIEGRKHADLRQIIGIFVNTLALRQYPEGEKTFVQFLKETRERTLAAFENQDYPFEELVDQVVVHRDPSRNPLFDVMFQFQAAQGQGEKRPPLKINTYQHNIKMSKFDLTLWGLEVGETLFFTFEYCTKLFEPEIIKKMITYFKTIIMSVLENPWQRLLNVEMLTKTEKKEELSQFTDNLEIEAGE